MQSLATTLRRFLPVLLLLPLFLSGCGGGGGSSTPSAQWRDVDPMPVQARKKWTFLVFLNAANNLEEYSQLNINQMEGVGSNDDVNIVVQIKRGANRWDPSFEQWKDSSTRRLYVTHDVTMNRINSRVLEINDLLDMGKAASLKEFVQWGTTNFPADRYALVLWNHGAGWRTQRTPGGRGVSYDDLTGSNINTVEIPGAIDIGRKWDVLAFDSSLMQMAEVAYEVRDKALYITGSEESPPGRGYPYGAFLSKLAADPSMNGRTFATAIAQDTIDFYGSGSNITHSALDASKVGAIAPAVNEMGRQLLRVQAASATGIAGARNLAENYTYPENRDLIDFCDLLLANPAGSNTPRVADATARAAISQARQAVLSALVVNVHGTQHPRSQGLAIFLPTPNQYFQIDDEQKSGFGQPYSQLAFTQAAPNWNAFLMQGPP